MQNILAVSGASNQRTVVLELESWDFGLELQLVCDVLADLIGYLAGFLCGLVDDYEGARLGNFEIDALAVWWVSTRC